MANFAKIINNNIVERLVAVSDDELIDENGQENEVLGIAFLKELFGYDTEWVQTSYNNNFRSKFACIGDTYDRTRDAFISPKPETNPSWVLNEQSLRWEPPIPIPVEEGFYFLWNEETQTWNKYSIPEPGPITQTFEWDEVNQVLIVRDIDEETTT